MCAAIMTHMHLDTIYYNYIKDGKKIYETRVYDEKRQKLKLLDIIEFKDRQSGDVFTATVVELAYFDNFREAIASVGVKKVLPNAKSLEDGISIYENFDNGNYKLNAQKFGVLRMKFKINK